MIPEVGHFALIVALALAAAQCFFGLAAPALQRERWYAAVMPAVAGQFVLTAFSFACLLAAFIGNDFSVRLVAGNSNTALPLFYRVTASWGNHEGSLLLWILILSAWTVAVGFLSRSLPRSFQTRVLGVLGFISTGFLLFALATSNPFERLLQVIPDGVDMNPVLQDFAVAVHPPTLYVGYVGLSVAFAFACAGMLEGRLDQAWARWSRPWTTIAWVFLTAGITLGSWWAYYELGWGGYWAWDPVENMIFLPWLIGTALIHSLAVTDRRGLFKSWTLLLSILGFSFSLLATFLVRSGTLTSVHSFAADPARGVFILALLVVMIGGALALYTWRAPLLRSQAGFDLLSRESFLLFNNILLVIATAVVFGGTMAPLIAEALGTGALSVGPPYFTPTFLVPTLPLLALLSVGMHASWKRGQLRRVRTPILGSLVLALALGLAIVLGALGGGSLLATVGTVLAIWIALGALVDPVDRLRRGLSLPASIVGMSLAHLGLALLTLGVTTVESSMAARDAALTRGQSVLVGGYDFRFEGVQLVEGPNYDAMRATLVASRDGAEVARLYPERRNYWVRREALAESKLDVRWNRDLLATLGEDLGNGAWSVRLQVRPLMFFIWLGALFMVAGGICAGLDKRYRRTVEAGAREAAAPPAPGLRPAGEGAG